MEENNSKPKNRLKILVFISVILIVIFIILDIKTSKENSFDSLGYACIGLIDAFILWLIWIIYLIKLTIIKKKNNSKYFWIPLIITVCITVAPIVLYFIVLSIKASYI